MSESKDSTTDGGGGTAGANGSSGDHEDVIATAVTIGVVGVAAALIEVSLIPGMIIGVAAAYAPKYLPRLGSGLQPMFRSAVRGAYKLSRKTRDAVAEAKEQVHDIVAEVHAEEGETAPARSANPQPPA
jgi:hypothetical protein